MSVSNKPTAPETTVLTKLSRAISIFQEYATQIIKARLDRGAIGTVERLVEFNHSRAAYVAQTSLYGYLKTRMGTKYVQYFQDPTFALSIDKAKWRVFASCLSDLTTFSCGIVHRESELDGDATAALAVHCFRRAVELTFEPDVLTEVGVPAMEAFEARARLTDWQAAADGETAFGRSPSDLVEFAPVIDDFKVLDSEIVMNSMRFRWRDVREQLRKRLSGPKVAENWSEA